MLKIQPSDVTCQPKMAAVSGPHDHARLQPRQAQAPTAPYNLPSAGAESPSPRTITATLNFFNRKNMLFSIQKRKQRLRGMRGSREMRGIRRLCGSRCGLPISQVNKVRLQQKQQLSLPRPAALFQVGCLALAGKRGCNSCVSF